MNHTMVRKSKLTREMPHKNWRRQDCLRCYRCGKRLAESDATWLDMRISDHRFSAVPWALADSQGGFAFGPDCAEIVLSEQK